MAQGKQVGGSVAMCARNDWGQEGEGDAAGEAELQERHAWRRD